MKLAIGYHHPFEIRRERYAVKVAERLTILYLSDLHFNGYSEWMMHEIIKAIRAADPAMILLGGDYVDTKKGLVYFNQLMQLLAERKNVFAVAGNHDYFFGVQKILEIVIRNGAQWIEKKAVELAVNGMTIRIDGNYPQLKKTTVDFAILCLHRPIDLQPYAANYQLVFAGHLHGCQAVLWQSEKGLFPGRFFYKWNRLQVKLGQCLCLISKGLGDTLPVRYNCAKDMILAELVPKKIPQENERPASESS